jgi:hypothetical protein
MASWDGRDIYPSAISRRFADSIFELGSTKSVTYTSTFLPKYPVPLYIEHKGAMSAFASLYCNRFSFMFQSREWKCGWQVRNLANILYYFLYLNLMDG